MNYLITIKTAILVFPIIAFFFTTPFILHQYHKYGSINHYRSLIIYSFILYMITVYFLVILPLPDINNLTKPSENMIRLIPFGFIDDIIKESSFILTNPKTYLQALKEPCFYTVIFNIFMTIPFGMYLRYYFRCNLKRTFILSFILSLFFELTQLTGLYFIYPYQYRVFDIDDLIMNTLGGVIGYFLMNILKEVLPSREEIDKRSLINSEVVSGFRRITIFLLDTSLFIFIYLFIQIFVKSFYINCIIFILYYIVIPYCSNGMTLGSKFLNVRLVYENHKFIRITQRVVFLYLYYLYLPYKFIYMFIVLKDILYFNTTKTIYLFLIYLTIVGIFYIINIVTILKKRKIYYDNLFKVEYQNTIKVDELLKR